MKKEIININQTEAIIILGDSKIELKKIPTNSVDLIFTSPPYADQRKKAYGGINPNQYVDWFLPFSSELKRILKPKGTFILNIKEKVVNGERHTYVIDLILQMKKQGWFWTEEYIWHKRNSFPGKWPNRFRDGWERLIQFNKEKKFNMYQDNVRVPIGNWSKTRLKNLSAKDKTRNKSNLTNNFGKKISNWVGKELVYPDNVLYLPTECGNKKHSAAFPESLPAWFIKLFTKQGDIVLDPFVGSGTTCVAAAKLLRNSIGIEIVESYSDLTINNLKSIDEKIGNQLCLI